MLKQGTPAPSGTGDQMNGQVPHQDTTAIALAMHTRGFHVFPADHPGQARCIGKHHTCDGQRGKHPAVSWGTWAMAATPQMIAQQWARHGGLANIAVACGPSNLVVLDEDAPGELERFAATYGIDLPPTYTVTTGRGRHLYYRWDHSSEGRIGNSHTAVQGFKLDVRGEGGYVIAEGSQHASGAPYAGNGLAVADLPNKLGDLLLACAYNQQHHMPGGNTAGPRLAGEMIPAGQRHTQLVKYAGRLRKSGLDLDEAIPVYRQRWLCCQQPAGEIPEAHYHDPACAHPLTWAEALDTLDDIYRRYPSGQNLEDADAHAPPPLAGAILTRSALHNLPDPEPFIDNVLDRGTLALLYGKWGSCKTFLALDIAVAVATGRPWQGRRTAQGRVLYVAAEGAYGLKPRVDALEYSWGLPISDDHLHILPRPVNLTRPAEVHQLKTLTKTNGYDLVILDTLSRCMVGGDENSAQDCGQVVDALHQLRDQTPGARGVVLAVHHTGKDGKTFRGSSVFEAGADTVYSVALDGALITVDREKRKDGPRHDTHRLKLSPVESAGSAIIEVVSPTDFEVRQAGRGVSLLSHFQSHFAHTGATSTQLLEVSAMPKATFYRALSDLIESGELINTGTDRRPFYILASK